MLESIAKVIGKLTGVLLAVTLAFYFLLNILPSFAKEIIHSDLEGRELMVGALILLMFFIVGIWAYAIRAFTKTEIKSVQARPSLNISQERSQETSEQEIQRMSNI